MTSAPVEVARRWFEEMWNQGRAELIPELLAADAPIHDVGAPADVQRGPEGFRRVYDKLKGAFPDIRLTIDRDSQRARHRRAALDRADDAFGRPSRLSRDQEIPSRSAA